MRPSNVQDEAPFCPPSQKQQAFLARHNIQDDRPMGFYDAMHRINTFVSERRKYAPTPKQEMLLRQHSMWKPGLSRGEAFDLIKSIFARDRL